MLANAGSMMVCRYSSLDSQIISQPTLCEACDNGGKSHEDDGKPVGDSPALTSWTHPANLLEDILCNSLQ